MLEIKTIESEKYVKVEGTNLLKHVGMITAREAFDQLEAHLKKVGLLPDEYFTLNSILKPGDNELPDFHKAVCSADWGGSEGIYIDISLEYTENHTGRIMRFATGKTLDESGDAFLRMSRIAAECSMMLNGRGCIVKVSENAYDNPSLMQEAKPSLTDQIQTAAAKASATQSDTKGREAQPQR